MVSMIKKYLTFNNVFYFLIEVLWFMILCLLFISSVSEFSDFLTYSLRLKINSTVLVLVAFMFASLIFMVLKSLISQNRKAELIRTLKYLLFRFVLFFSLCAFIFVVHPPK